MAWRTILIQNTARLALAKNQLQITSEGGVFTLPLEDIGVLILESPQIMLSSSLLAACQDKGVGVVTCGGTHMPNGLLLPFHPHSRQTRICTMQINWSEALQKRLWQKTIIAKISNQAACLKAARGEDSAHRLYALAGKVNSGDPENIEAQAARDYWPKLFGPDFRRHAPDTINAALNYGYAILRAFIARSQVGYGLLPCFGFHHCGELNAFNLTDDVMEVLRPSIDWHVLHLVNTHQLTTNEPTLSVEHRQKLAGVGNIRAMYSGQLHTITTLADKLAEGLVGAIEAKTPSLFLTPEFYRSETDMDEQ